VAPAAPKPTIPDTTTGAATPQRATPTLPPTTFDALQIRFGDDVCHDLARSSKKEWLITNGVGGYAMSTVIGLNTRRHHGLLVAARRGTSGRSVVLSRIEEKIRLPNAVRALDTVFYPGVVHPKGYEYMESFTLYPVPTFTYVGRRWRLEKRVALVQGENTVVVRYKLLPKNAKKDAPPPPAPRPKSGTASDAISEVHEAHLCIRPLFAFRDSEALAKSNDRIQRTFGVRHFETGGSIVRCTPYPEWEPVYLVCRGAEFQAEPDWYKQAEYPQERYRGLEFREDLWSYGSYDVALAVGQEVTIICTLHPPEAHAAPWSEAGEAQRRLQLLRGAPDDGKLGQQLTLAADQFIVRRERDIAAVVSGYPWSFEHVRDTMIALPGLLLVTGRFREAKSILRSYARAMDHGLLPNQFPDAGERAEYTSVDATLWFFVAIFKYLQYTGDFEFVKTELRIPLLETMRYFEEGARFGIRIERDGLLSCGEPGLALTWMDAKVGAQPLTQRAGKAVDVNALWYNALKIMERLGERFSIPGDMARFARRAEQVEEHFLPVFWNARRSCLNDVVSPMGADTSLRPNQLLAISLPFPLLDSESQEQVVDVVTKNLLTPVGVRTLEPGHTSYEGKYDGNPNARARAVHQGTAWTWLLGPYITASIRARGEPARAVARRILHTVEEHFCEDGLGQVSELSWGDEPYWPRGSVAHAAAVGELLRCYAEDVLGKRPDPDASRRLGLRRRA
jgi:predicted glycogen debranching enzyme